jgi:quinol monooxygenase YgiN
MKISRRALLAGSAGFAGVPLVGSPWLAAQEKKLPKDAVTLIAEIEAKAGQEQAVKRALEALVEPTRKEQGCICYNLHQSTDDKAKFVFYEQWASQAALDKHMQTDHFKAMQTTTEGKLEGIKASTWTLL